MLYQLSYAPKWGSAVVRTNKKAVPVRCLPLRNGPVFGCVLHSYTGGSGETNGFHWWLPRSSRFHSGMTETSISNPDMVVWAAQGSVEAKRLPAAVLPR